MWQFVQCPAPREWQKVRDDQPDVPVPGDLIWVRRRQWRVKSAHVGSGLTRVIVDGLALSESRSFLLPCDRWSPDVSRRTRPVSNQRALAWLAACAARVRPAFTPGSIVRSKASLLAYQLEPALAILAGKRRVLIADDVGLGKTIQAALIVSETLDRSADARVLVVAPAALLTQWSDELRERFAVVAHTADAHSFTRLRSDRPYLSNPWRSPGVWLASPDYLKQPHVIDGMPRLPFDLLVIDEAHTMAGTSQRHSAIDALARSARQVVMLTATPHDGDATRFMRLMSLGSTECATRPQADALTIFRRTRTGPVRHLRSLYVSPGAGLSRVLAAIDSFERTRRLSVPGDGLALICAVFRKRALSSLAALAASLNRRLAIVNGAAASNEDGWMQPDLSFHEDGALAPEDEEEWPAMKAVTGLPQARERAWLERLLSLTARVSSNETGGDPKLTRLTSLLRRSREPVVVFTEYRDSLLAIAGVLAATRRVAVLHGGLPGAEQRRALKTFLGGDADALLATDVASQGLNLQHRARWVVHFDLPWTPMRLEQRIGRVDRIGQTRPVHVTAIGVRHQAQMAVRQRVATRREISDNARLCSCTRWTRAAEGLARLFARQRALATRWRGPDPSALPRAHLTASTLRALGLETQTGLPVGTFQTVPRSLTIVEIPLVTSTGEVLERWLGWTTGPRDVHDDPPAALVRHARALSVRARGRLARLQAAQGTAGRLAPIQPGLFDARDLAGARAVANDAVESNETAPDVRVRVGEPRPLVIL
jgi:superfamily II DNA or RNA helicase